MQPEAKTIIPRPPICAKHCSVCEGQDHHWDFDFDERTDNDMLICRHCDAVRLVQDEDFPDDE